LYRSANRSLFFAVNDVPCRPLGAASFFLFESMSAFPTRRTCLSYGFAIFAALRAQGACAQQPAPAPSTGGRTAAEDHQQMMTQLGIRALRPGPSGNEAAPNHANYDEATANPFPVLPSLMTRHDGRPVTTAAQWPARRAELLEDFSREVYGRVPANAPTVTWTVAATDTGTVAGHRVIGRQLMGHVDNRAYPALSVDISLMLVTPGLMMDKLHPTVKGYQLWADALKPILAEILGPPAAVDLAPPPTGDPSVKPPAG
jgi:hypothetical protein